MYFRQFTITAGRQYVQKAHMKVIFCRTHENYERCSVKEYRFTIMELLFTHSERPKQTGTECGIRYVQVCGIYLRVGLTF